MNLKLQNNSLLGLVQSLHSIGIGSSDEAYLCMIPALSYTISFPN